VENVVQRSGMLVNVVVNVLSLLIVCLLPEPASHLFNKKSSRKNILQPFLFLSFRVDVRKKFLQKSFILH